MLVHPVLVLAGAVLAGQSCEKDLEVWQNESSRERSRQSGVWVRLVCRELKDGGHFPYGCLSACRSCDRVGVGRNYPMGYATAWEIRGAGDGAVDRPLAVIPDCVTAGPRPLHQPDGRTSRRHPRQPSHRAGPTVAVELLGQAPRRPLLVDGLWLAVSKWYDGTRGSPAGLAHTPDRSCCVTWQHCLVARIQLLDMGTSTAILSLLNYPETVLAG